jgi:hypothetical protein
VTGASTAGTSHRAHGRSATRSGCRRGNPLANVYHPYRLKVRRRCLVVTGTVAYVSREDDGDLHVDLSLPADEAWLLDRANLAYQYGQLVTEIAPADQPGCTVGEPPRSPHGTYNFGICTGADIATPPVGAVIRVTGPYLLDANHGWMEIHPVWRIVVVSKPPTVALPDPGLHLSTADNRSLVSGQRLTCE